MLQLSSFLVSAAPTCGLCGCTRLKSRVQTLEAGCDESKVGVPGLVSLLHKSGGAYPQASLMFNVCPKIMNP